VSASSAGAPLRRFYPPFGLGDFGGVTVPMPRTGREPDGDPPSAIKKLQSRRAVSRGWNNFDREYFLPAGLVGRADKPANRHCRRNLRFAIFLGVRGERAQSRKNRGVNGMLALTLYALASIMIVVTFHSAARPR
jgi:hypothetical protein